jgi:hypothetical protein
MPSAAQAKAAAAKGVALWSGYLATRPGVGLYSPWSQAGFENARLCGSTPIAFCSGWDSPGALKALAAAWNVRLCLDIESGIRPDGPWKQPWLDASGAGVYGNYGCHAGVRAAFHVLAAYPGSADVRATWWSATPRPATPCGWQWAGTHTEFGIGVDRGDYDDFFGGLHGGGGGTITGDDMTPDQEAKIDRLTALLTPLAGMFWGVAGSTPVVKKELDDILAAASKATSGGGLSAADSAKIDALIIAIGAANQTLNKIETALKGA